MQRPPWLRWQPIKFSPWLVAYLVFSALVIWLPEILLEWRVRGGTFVDAYFRSVRQRTIMPPTVYSTATGLALTAGLVWITYFSQSQRVKDHDKFAVFLMLCGSAAGLVLMFISHTAR